MERKYIVYEHVSPDGKRYIGITSQKITTRWRHGNGYSKNKHFYRSIVKYGWEKFEHNILLTEMCEEMAKEKEKELIKKYNTTDPKYGYNVTRGGDTRQPCPNEVKEKIRNKNKGRVVSEETRKKISLAKTGVKRGPMSDTQKEKISKSLLGNKRAMGHHNYSVRVAMCDDDNNIIKIFEGSPLAAEELHCSNSGILIACKENSKTCGLENTKYGGTYAGYKWFYINENGDIINNNHGIKTNLRSKEIHQYDLQGNKIKEYKTIKSAAEANGISKNGLSNAMKGKKETAYQGFLWVNPNNL